jgi:hypothetical protein
LSNDSEAVIFKVSKAIGPSLDEFHFPVKALSDFIYWDISFSAAIPNL